MPSYFLIHHLAAALAGILIVAAFLSKRGRRAYFNLHYWLGSAGVAGLVLAVSAAVWVYRLYGRQTGTDLEILAVFGLHVALALAVLITGLAQGVLGWLIYFYPRLLPAWLVIHRRISYVLVISTGLAAVFGAIALSAWLQWIPARLVLWLSLLGILVVPVLAIAIWNTLRPDRRSVHRLVGPKPAEQPARSPGAGPAIEYLPDGMHLSTTSDLTILQTSLRAGIAHTHVCGGNARCSTCRVVVLEGLAHCRPRNEREQAMAERLGFSENIRLACQTRVTGRVKIRRLVLDEEDIALTSQLQQNSRPGKVGEEKSLAILFIDIRDFTNFARTLPAYDVVHALNRFYQRMGRVVQRNLGQINNYLGDGMLVLFDDPDPKTAAIAAVRTGLEMVTELGQMRPYFRRTYGSSLDIGVGIHWGEAVVGNLGSAGEKRSLVIGDAINIASRIEAANKQVGTRILISEHVFSLARDHIRTGGRFSVPIKGVPGEQTLYEVIGLAAE